MCAWPSTSARTKTWGTEILTAGDLDGQFDILHQYNNDQLNSTTGHNHSGGTSEGPQLDLTSAIKNVLAVSNGGTGSSAAANTAGAVVVPTGAINAPNGAVILNSAGFLTVFNPYIKISDVKTSGTPGGTATSGSWITRVLNTIDSDTSTIASIGANQITLPAGIYKAFISSSFYNTDVTQIRLFNVTATASLLIGQNIYLHNAVLVGGSAVCLGIFILSVTSNISVQYQVGVTQNANGLGLAGNFGSEVYTIAEFIKIG